MVIDMGGDVYEQMLWIYTSKSLRLPLPRDMTVTTVISAEKFTPLSCYFNPRVFLELLFEEEKFAFLHRPQVLQIL